MGYLSIIVSICLISSYLKAEIICEDDYNCYEDLSRNIVWVTTKYTIAYGPDCKDICEDALINNEVFHSCDDTVEIFHDMESFNNVLFGLGFICDEGDCWDSKSLDGQIWVNPDYNSTHDPETSCFFPRKYNNTNGTFDCNGVPGSANCWREKYSIVCPCVEKPLNEACVWENPPNKPSIPQFPSDDDIENEDEPISCVDRINYWRKRACEENWIECPPSGLPPMTECTCCHECANSQSKYDSENWAHASFKQCGERVQGSGGGKNCAAVIDGFIEERGPDENGTWRCSGHCGPIVAEGCQTFFWGQYNGHYTINWRSCDPDECNAYCADPTREECFYNATIANEVVPDISRCDGNWTTTGVPTTGVPTGMPTTGMPTTGMPTSGETIAGETNTGEGEESVDEKSSSPLLSGFITMAIGYYFAMLTY